MKKLKLSSNKDAHIKLKAVGSIVLIIVAGLLVALSISPLSPVSAADNTYTENFDDDSTGAVSASNPSESWFKDLETTTDFGFDDWSISTAQANSGTKSMKLEKTDGDASDDDLVIFPLNTTNEIDVEWVNISFYLDSHVTSAGDFFYFLATDDDFGGGGDIGDNIWSDATSNSAFNFRFYDNDIKYYDTAAHTITSSTDDTWMDFAFQLNYTDDTFRVLIDSTPYGWYNFQNDVSGIAYLVFRSSRNSVTYFDDLSVSSDSTLGGALSEESDFTLSGYDGSKRITWVGEAGETVWSNETSYGTLVANITANATDNITEMRLYANDLGGDFDASNITVYVSSNNADYAVVAHNQGNGNGVFPTDGGNISINASTFPGSGAGSNPFTDGINDETVLLYFRFTLTFPDSETSSTSYSKTDWVDYYLSVPEV